jgi:uncharacterized protein (DUF433 family)
MSTDRVSLFASLGPLQQVSPPAELNLFEKFAEPRKYQADDILLQIQSNLQFLQRKLRVASPAVAKAVAIDTSVMHGNPVFSGTRIPIYQIVEELADGTHLEDLAGAYPSLTEEKIRQGLDFVSSLLRIYDDEISY